MGQFTLYTPKVKFSSHRGHLQEISDDTGIAVYLGRMSKNTGRSSLTLWTGVRNTSKNTELVLDFKHNPPPLRLERGRWWPEGC